MFTAVEVQEPLKKQTVSSCPMHDKLVYVKRRCYSTKKVRAVREQDSHISTTAILEFGENAYTLHEHLSCVTSK